MAPDDRLRIELLHSLGWMFFHRNTRRRWLEQINAGHLVLPGDVPHASAFATPSGEEHLVLGRAFQPLGILLIDDETYDHSANLAFTFPEASLRAHLEATDRLALVALDPLIPTFLSEAARFGSAFRSSRDGREAIASLPISQAAFDVPAHFQAAVQALCQCRLCAQVDGRTRWSAPVRPHMEAAYLWIGDQTRDQVREAELTKIWTTMPAKLKSLVTGGGKGGVDVLSLALALTHLWYKGKWHKTPRNRELVKLGADGISGDHIVTAKEISRLLEDGKLRA